MVKSPRQTSYFGILALLGGAAALVLTKFNPTGISTVNVGPYVFSLPAAVGLGSLVIAILAFLRAATSGRIRTGIPMLAVLISGSAVALAFYPALANYLPKSQPAKTSTPAPASPGAPIAAQPMPSSPDVQQPAGENNPSRTKTIFDGDYPSSTPPPAPANKTAASPVYPAIPPSFKPKANPAVTVDNTAAIRTAKAKYDIARQQVIASLAASPEYQSAKADADAAAAQVEKARSEYGQGSEELIAARKASLDAQSKLQKIISDAQANDPAGQAAASELKAAQSLK